MVVDCKYSTHFQKEGWEVETCLDFYHFLLFTSMGLLSYIQCHDGTLTSGHCKKEQVFDVIACLKCYCYSIIYLTATPLCFASL